jgi:hypothetical protein
MQSFARSALATAGFSVLFALTAACGGSQKEAKAPGGDPTDPAAVGSSSPAPIPETTTPEPPKPTAVASADNGSDIIPPFTSSKEPAAKKASPAKTSKKGPAKPKKKGGTG